MGEFSFSILYYHLCEMELKKISLAHAGKEEEVTQQSRKEMTKTQEDQLLTENPPMSSRYGGAVS